MAVREKSESTASVGCGREELRPTELLQAALRNLGETPGPGELQVGRDDISFGNVRPGVVRIRLTVWNRGPRASQPTGAAIQAAPLGAFLPWQPLAEVLVPALGPGASIDVTTEVLQPPVRPIGSFANLPPRRLLTALLNPDERPAGTASQLLSRIFAGRRRLGLPPDLFALLGRANPHWAGNLNVFIGGRPVERHLAQALRIYPGRTNLAMFVVGCGRDAYRLQAQGDGAAWTELFDATGRASLLDDDGSGPILQSEWIEVDRSGLMFLAMCPPEGCQEGNVEVHVTQRSTGQTAIVEFSLDAAAAGPGCYVV
jgi:hypothetical protein